MMAFISSITGHKSLFFFSGTPSLSSVGATTPVQYYAIIGCFESHGAGTARRSGTKDHTAGPCRGEHLEGGAPPCREGHRGFHGHAGRKGLGHRATGEGP